MKCKGCENELSPDEGYETVGRCKTDGCMCINIPMSLR